MGCQSRLRRSVRDEFSIGGREVGGIMDLPGTLIVSIRTVGAVFVIVWQSSEIILGGS